MDYIALKPLDILVIGFLALLILIGAGCLLRALFERLIAFAAKQIERAKNQ